jgi:hypothetical protein
MIAKHMTTGAMQAVIAWNKSAARRKAARKFRDSRGKRPMTGLSKRAGLFFIAHPELCRKAAA